MRTKPATTTRSWTTIMLLVGVGLCLILAIALIFLSAYNRQNQAGRAPDPAVLANAQAYSQAFQAYDSGDLAAALTQAQALEDPALTQFFEWQKLIRTPARTQAHRNFTSAKAHWPEAERMARQIGQSADLDLSARERLAIFTAYPPISPSEHRIYFRALGATEQTQTLRTAVRAYWTSGAILDAQETEQFYLEFGGALRPRDHEARFHQLLARTASDGSFPQAELAASAAAMRYLVPAELDLVRLAWATGTQEDLAAVPEQWQHHAALKTREAWGELPTDPTAAALIFGAIDPETRNLSAEWRLRRIQIRNAIRAGDVSPAYDLAANHGLGTTTDGQIGELLAGWIALTYLRQPELAQRHYSDAANTDAGPWVRSKALRGLARALTAQGRDSQARQALEDCAALQTTLYALLCLEELGQSLPSPSRPQVGMAENAEFEDLFAVIKLLIDQARPEKDLVVLVRAGFNAARSQEELDRLARLIAHRADLAMTHTLGVAGKRGTPAFFAPAMRTLDLNPAHQSNLEPALTLAVISQESQFRPTVGSPAGARGLMQLLPATAQQTAAELDLVWSDDMLTDGPTNIRLGNAYLAKLLKRYDGSYLLALAAYNAGPSRVSGWLRDFGDPRKGEISGEDWIDALTIGETRLYVQRVLTNVLLYRAVQGGRGVSIDLKSLMQGS